MVRAVNHGGACCGAYHLYGFTEVEEANPSSIVYAFNAVVPNTRMTEVILNGRQVESSPRTLEKLAEMGFVLDRHWINGNHNSHNYAFSRCDNRRTLELPQWPGMIASVGLHGTMPRLAGAEIPLQRHLGGGEREERVIVRDREVVREVPAPAPRVTVVATFFVNRYRTTGRSRHYFLSYAQAENARREVQGVTTDRLDIMSNGDHNWTENAAPF